MRLLDVTRDRVVLCSSVCTACFKELGTAGDVECEMQVRWRQQKLTISACSFDIQDLGNVQLSSSYNSATMQQKDEKSCPIIL